MKYNKTLICITLLPALFASNAYASVGTNSNQNKPSIGSISGTQGSAKPSKAFPGGKEEYLGLSALVKNGTISTANLTNFEKLYNDALISAEKDNLVAALTPLVTDGTLTQDQLQSLSSSPFFTREGFPLRHIPTPQGPNNNTPNNGSPSNGSTGLAPMTPFNNPLKSLSTTAKAKVTTAIGGMTKVDSTTILNTTLASMVSNGQLTQNQSDAIKNSLAQSSAKVTPGKDSRDHEGLNPNNDFKNNGSTFPGVHPMSLNPGNGSTFPGFHPMPLNPGNGSTFPGVHPMPLNPGNGSTFPGVKGKKEDGMYQHGLNTLTKNGIITTAQAQNISKVIGDALNQAKQISEKAALDTLVSNNTITSLQESNFLATPRVRDSLTSTQKQAIDTALKSMKAIDQNGIISKLLSSLVSNGTITLDQSNAILANLKK